MVTELTTQAAPVTETPPRWRHEPDWDIGLQITQRVYEDNERLSSVCYVPNFDGQAETRARLISAAPELLSALQIAQHYVRYLSRGHTSVCDCDPCRELRTVEATISKATGGVS